MFPTPVGMNRLELVTTVSKMNVPHACGDEPDGRRIGKDNA